MSEIKVSFAALAAAQTDVTSSAGRLSGQLDDLKGYLTPLVATWSGQAAEEYQMKQKQWDVAAADLKDVLAKIGVGLGQAEEAYRQAEGANTSRWA